MAEFLRTAGIIDRVETIIDRAEHRLVLITPYVQLSSTFLERICGAAERGVQVILVYGKTGDLREEEEVAVSQIRDLDLRYYGDLHAKCYFSEQAMVLASMNLYRASSRNREMGIFLEASEQAYADAVAEAEQIICNADSKRLRAPRRPATDLLGGLGLPTVPREGHCIRCGDDIDYDPERPFCPKCYRSWVRWSNEEYEELYCHTCGDDASTSFAKPQCWGCYKTTGAPARLL